MPALPLVAHASADAIVAWREDGAVTRQQFLAEVLQLAALLPSGRHLINLCADRYRFSVGLAAAIVSGRVSLLPPTHTPAVVRQLRDFAPDVFCLTDRDDCAVDLPQLRYPPLRPAPAQPIATPLIARDQRVAVLFTSGSTGAPQAHAKSWGALVASVVAEAGRLAVAPASGCTIVGTVPAQHMYGFESTVLLPWQSANALAHCQPFFPDDIGRALAAVPAPRLLVSSPAHLRAWLEAATAIPGLAGVVSATAPLSARLAAAIEARCQAPLMEIYGSTETGQIASRRSTQGDAWRLFPGVKLIADGDRVRARGEHVETTSALNDLIEVIDDKHFLLGGRLSDLVNIAGKRHSLAALNHLLTSIPGVNDGAFFMPDEASDERITRLAACVVAPTLDARRLRAALRQHIDPVFLPRPLLFVAALPRNSTGKLPRADLQALFARLPAKAAMTDALRLSIPREHPAFAGHFPGTPIFPGVLLLDRALQRIAAATGFSLDVCTIASVKFLGPARPGDEVLITHTLSASGTLRFEIVAGDEPARRIASGSVVPGPAAGSR